MARPRQISDEQIDAAARETFIAHGVGAPVSLVAAKLGVSHAALLQRAGSKEKLQRRALSGGVPALAAQLQATPPEHGRAQRLSSVLLDLLLFHERMLPGLMALRAGGITDRLPKGHEAPTLRLRRALASWLSRAGLPRRRCAVLADALLGAIEARCFNSYLGGPSFIEHPHRRFINQLVRGLVPELDTRLTRSES
ncbi:MAG: TetR/AcrR family transcriptional regulator [Archangium sp.]|nr:TetR/AcrR family transcriptional regulator [Archangium sp.]